MMAMKRCCTGVLRLCDMVHALHEPTERVTLAFQALLGLASASVALAIAADSRRPLRFK